MKTECFITQSFAGNGNPSYRSSGLQGHTAVDECCGYGSDIHSYVDGFVYKVIDDKHPANDNSGYWGIFMIVDDGFELYEFSIGHCSKIFVKEGDYVKKGQLIGEEGNKGNVYSGGVKITLAMQAAGDTRGSHRHVQKRPVKKVKKTDPKKVYLQGFGQVYFDKEGYYYEVIDHENGYAGCVDPLLPVFHRDLYLGLSGYDVYLLQKFLQEQGDEMFESTGLTGKFGPKTLAGVIRFQKRMGIFPQHGYFGKKTREKALKLLS